MGRRLPSLTALRAFEAAARHLSFTSAAAEMNVTQGAVSHQVKALEQELGQKLFLRHPHGLVLTEAGRQLQAVAREAFDRIAAGFDRVRAGAGGGVLKVRVLPSFAAKWLLHRLPRFMGAHPEIDLSIDTDPDVVDFAREDVDVAVRRGSGRWPGLRADRLAAEALIAVCSPAVAKGPPPLRRPQDLARVPLIHLGDRNDWRDWLEGAGVSGIDLAKGIVFKVLLSLGIDAAIEGQGVTLALRTLVTEDLVAGRLVQPFAFALPMREAFYVVCPEAAAEQPKIKAFRDWMLAEAARDEERLRAAMPSRPSQRRASGSAAIAAAIPEAPRVASPRGSSAGARRSGAASTRRSS